VPTNTAEPPETAPTPSGADAQLPPEFVECMADQEIESADEIHSAPMEAPQTCLPTLSGWQTARAHRAFGHPMGPHLQAVGMGMRDHIERLRIEKLGWN